MVETAGEQLVQILLNLLQNAVRHTSTQVKLTLDLSGDDHADWIFHIDDDGAGLNEHERQHIFVVLHRKQWCDWTGTDDQQATGSTSPCRFGV